MFLHYFVLIVFIVVGVALTIISLCNPDWFFASRNTQFVVESIGRTKARVVYGSAGLLMIIASIGAYLQLYYEGLV